KLKKILVTDELRDAQLHLAQRMRRGGERAGDHDPESLVDGLTRLYNRRYFENRLDEELIRASRMQNEVAAIFVVLSGLEDFSRACGTLHADDAVLAAARAIRQTVRRSDILTRYDSDRFALILPYTGEAAQRVEARLRATLAELLRQSGIDRKARSVTIGVGHAIYPRDARKAPALAKTAFLNSEADLAPTEELALAA
ncbi:MAG TPA: diguanylate cyclase, partial [Chthonomonadales bacterium]|nr:diguanylate cyclase [Chthonomonadales bacterium]